MYNPPLVPDDFVVPTVFETERMRLRMLTVDDVEKDYAAVMESAAYLKTVYDPGGEWPTGLTLEQNRLELAWHQTEFQLKTSFAYTVLTLDELSVLGCLYLYPTRKAGYDVEVTMWVRESERETGLDDHLYQAVTRWVEDIWPFENPAYPGRTISHEDWRSLRND